MKSKKILVPTDFTPVADNALKHAINLAKAIHAEVVALHVVAKSTELDAARTKLDAQASALQAGSGVTVTGLVRIGNIFDDIGETATELGVALIVMGTHGLKGIQYVTGSWAMKVISHATAPFVIVQENSALGSLDNIVLPIDFSKESKQQLGFAADMAQYFDSKIHIVCSKHTDEFLVNALNRNVGYAKKYLDERNIDFDVKLAEDSNFVKEVVKYAEELNADLITLMNLSDNNMTHLFGSGNEQKMITNEAQIPVMIINPKSIGTFAAKLSLYGG